MFTFDATDEIFQLPKDDGRRLAWLGAELATQCHTVRDKERRCCVSENDIQWAIVELMGHIRMGGFVTEEERFGSKIGRIDIYDEEGNVTTQYFGGSSVFRITPTTKVIAQAIGCRGPEAISRWELRALEPADVARPTARDMYEDAVDDSPGDPDDDDDRDF